MSELCRKHGMSDATVYKWEAKYGGRRFLRSGDWSISRKRTTN
ncbi:MAG: hypothetical protein JKY94_13120 [Rhodobacteraceae bacterium]|nr:hypothetical protein [Paracoccaceae bacterium]